MASRIKFRQRPDENILKIRRPRFITSGEEAEKLQDGADVDCSMEETTIGTIWPDIALDNLAGRTVYHVTSRLRDNYFMFEHFFFQTDAGVNMVIGVFYPKGDETARKDMMNQFLAVEFLK